MRSPENQPLISIGITYRKDVYPHGEVRTMEQFFECVGRGTSGGRGTGAKRYDCGHELLRFPYIAVGVPPALFVRSLVHHRAMLVIPLIRYDSVGLGLCRLLPDPPDPRRSSRRI